MLQPATVADLMLVASWITSARECALWAGWSIRFPMDLEALPAAMDLRETNSFSLFDNGRLIAFGQLFSKSSGRGHLSRLIVSPASRREGYGEALVRGLLVQARQQGYHRVSLYVDEANAAAIALYTKLGFCDAQRPADDVASPGSRYMEIAI